ncbi:MAG TPA: NUDIX domain-containing protein [Balneolaceae bacterium]|nr:NUDIX domain-containing protein [Balneolaceae bacterium]
MAGESFKNKIRLRVNGILQKNKAILLVQLKSPVNNKLIWMPPGGGLRFGELMESGLQREFLQETGLQVEVNHLVFVNELVHPPFHAIECYFSVRKTGGTLKMGSDPELSDTEQILKDLKWINIDQIQDMQVAPAQLPALLQNASLPRQIPHFKNK